MSTSRLVLPNSDCCIYCGSTEELTVEHIIPYSLGGRIELPDGSCRKCADITKKIEQSVARSHLQIPRAIGGVQTRRPGQRPNETTVKLEFADGRTAKKKFSLDIAPIIHTVPSFRPNDPNWMASDLLSLCTLQAMGHWQNPARYQKIMNLTGANKVTASSGSYGVGTWELVLWKMASGFLHVVCPKSLKGSGRALAIVGRGSMSITRKKRTSTASAEKSDLLYEDLFSHYVVDKVRNFGAAKVYTTQKDAFKSIYSELNVLSALSFPRYTCRIPNLDRLGQFEREFSILEEDKHLGKDAELLFMPDSK